MNDHGQQARASENFAGPVDFKTPRPDLPVHFFKLSEDLVNHVIAVNLWVDNHLLSLLVIYRPHQCNNGYLTRVHILSVHNHVYPSISYPLILPPAHVLSAYRFRQFYINRAAILDTDLVLNYQNRQKKCFRKKLDIFFCYACYTVCL